MLALDYAWKVLEVDFDEMAYQIRVISDREEKVKFAIRSLDLANRLGRKLLAQYHPDKGHDGTKFLEIQNALESIKFYVNDLIEKHASGSLKPEKVKLVF